ncbi:hypothetical protein B0H17DRAFT_1211426 [Mycena rosella]|uniref:Uncharacterized protein n=1 Tax=Mycena rosella TaxID=1033263 RepID=A0AAD7CU73_MYCRO|nr:hypothetical protein B0H17DRAFT_1211426 [Mycena rosella]
MPADSVEAQLAAVRAVHYAVCGGGIVHSTLTPALAQYHALYSSTGNATLFTSTDAHHAAHVTVGHSIPLAKELADGEPAAAQVEALGPTPHLARTSSTRHALAQQLRASWIFCSERRTWWKMSCGERLRTMGAAVPSSMSNLTASQAARYEAHAAAAATKDGHLNATPTKSTQSAPASPTSLRQSLRTKLVDSNPSPRRNSADGLQVDLEGGDAPTPIVTSDRYGPPKHGRPSGHVALSASVQPSGTHLETVSTTPPGSSVRLKALKSGPQELEGLRKV